MLSTGARQAGRLFYASDGLRISNGVLIASWSCRSASGEKLDVRSVYH